MWYGTGTPRWVVRPQPLQVAPFVGFCVRVSIILFDRYMSSELDRLIGDTPLFSGVPFIFMFTDMDILYRYVIPVLGIVNAFTEGFCMGKDGYSSLLPRFSPSLEVVSLVGSFRGSPICFPSKDDLEEIQGDRLFAAGNFFLVEIAVRCGLETEWIG